MVYRSPLTESLNLAFLYQLYEKAPFEFNPHIRWNSVQVIRSPRSKIAEVKEHFRHSKEVLADVDIKNPQN